MTSYLTFFVKTEDGPSVFVRDYAPDRPSGKLPVICLHGLTRNSADFEAVAPAIAQTGRRVITADMRGRGQTGNDPNPQNYRPDIYARDVTGILDALDIPRAVFIGTSMGGIITMILAATARERIGAVVLNDIGPELDPKGLMRIASYVGKAVPLPSWDAMIAAIRETQGPAFPDAGDRFWRTFAQRVARKLPDGRVEFAYDPAIAQAFATPPKTTPPSMVPMFQALATGPVLAVRGELSDILSPAGLAAMMRLKPDLKVAEIPRVGHAPTLEEPAAWCAVLEFLAAAP
ncbi:MAG TPA: alpha/beta hydrolase [Rhizomicrobium sp.]|jgi:pimeloyl-ACP methyl ester carboxylesterase|nr:alpha/beta hydrolase [Rhizomicrobium sp.]